MKELISVVIPAYNEAQYIEQNVRETVQTLSELNYRFEIIVVDDGSHDDTHLQAVKVRSQHAELVRVVRYDRNRGKGNALICGSGFARGEIIAFLDADMDLHPRQLPTLFAMLEANDADVVIGSKRHPLSRVDYPKARKVLSFGYFALIRLLFGLPLRDTQTGLKVFRRKVVEAVFPRVLAKRFAFDIEVLANAHRLKFKIVDAPVTLEFRRKLGRINFRDIMRVFMDTLAIFYRMRIIHYYDRLGGIELMQVAAESMPRELDAPTPLTPLHVGP